MRYIRRIINTALIFTLIGVFLSSNPAYPDSILRVPLKFSEEKAPNPPRGKRIYNRISKAMRKYSAFRREAIENGGYFKTIKVPNDNGDYIEARVWTKIRHSDFMLSRFILTIEKIMHRMKKELFTKL